MMTFGIDLGQQQYGDDWSNWLPDSMTVTGGMGLVAAVGGLFLSFVIKGRT